MRRRFPYSDHAMSMPGNADSIMSDRINLSPRW